MLQAASRALGAGFLRLPALGAIGRARHYAITTDTGEDTHDDFKPKQKTAPATAGDAASIIHEDVTSHDVFLYMKGMPEAPQCGFSNMACKILDAYGRLLAAFMILLF